MAVLEPPSEVSVPVNTNGRRITTGGCPHVVSVEAERGSIVVPVLDLSVCFLPSPSLSGLETSWNMLRICPDPNSGPVHRVLVYGYVGHTDGLSNLYFQTTTKAPQQRMGRVYIG